jgi:hypothetical protein
MIVVHSCGHAAAWEPMPEREHEWPQAKRRFAGELLSSFPCPWCGGETGVATTYGAPVPLPEWGTVVVYHDWGMVVREA